MSTFDDWWNDRTRQERDAWCEATKRRGSITPAMVDTVPALQRDGGPNAWLQVAGRAVPDAPASTNKQWTLMEGFATYIRDRCCKGQGES